jgi:hypothetical protein
MKTKLKHTTRRIAGHAITLAEGVRYIATRNMGTLKTRTFTVTIQAAIGSPLAARSAVLPGLTRRDADAFLAAFNHGPSWLDGRIWMRAEVCEVCEEGESICEAEVLGTTRALCASCRAGGAEIGVLDEAGRTAAGV